MRIFVLLSVLVLSVAADIPISDKCRKNDPKLNRCLKKIVKKGWPEFAKANNLQHIPNEFYKNIPNLFEVWMKNGSLDAFDVINFKNISVDFKKRTFDINYFQPNAYITGNYKLLGGFLGLKIDDEGKASANFVNGTYKYHFNYDIEQRDGEEYIQIKTFKLTYVIDRLIVDMDSRTNPEQGEQIERLFNNFWSVLNLLAQGAVGEIFSEAYTPIIQQYFSQHSLKSLFN